MSCKIAGKIVKFLPVEKGVSGAGKEWQKQSFVIDTGDQYNPEVCFSMFGDEKVEKLNQYNKVGDEVEVSFNLSSREFNGKYYHNLDAWRLDKIGADTASGAAATEEDDLPF